MKTIANAVFGIIEKNPVFKFGISQGLFNLTQLAKLIRPQVEALTKKEVKSSAILMSLSRMQKSFTKTVLKPSDFEIETITIYSNLCILTFPKTRKIGTGIGMLHKYMQKKAAYFTLSEGMNQITLIVKDRYKADIRDLMTEEPIKTLLNVSAIAIKFPEKHNQTPGFIHLMLQQLAFQGVNLLELTSTYTEIFLYIDKKDAKPAVDTIIGSFDFN